MTESGCPPCPAIKGIVLAAGMSTRMGRPKQLLEVAGKPLIVHVVERCLASRLDDVLVVVGHETAAVRHALTGLDVFFVINPDYADGQSTSLIAGLEAAAHGTDAIVVVLADQPGIDPGTIDRLIAVRRDHGATIAMAEYGTERSHPILFGNELFEELRGISGDKGARELIRHHHDDIVVVPGGSSVVPLDVDTEEAYARLLERQSEFGL